MEININTENESEVESRLIDEALVHHQRGEFDKAEEIYRQVIKINPKCFDAFNLLGLIKYQCSHFLDSLDLFKQAIGIYPANPGFYLNLGRSLEKLERYQDALSVFKEAIKLDPEYIDSYYEVGLIYQKIQESTLALNYLDLAIQKNPNLLSGYLAKIAVLTESCQYEKAFSFLESAKSLFNDAPEIHLSLGLIYEGRGEGGDLDKAIEAYTHASSLRDKYESAIFNRGNVYQKLSLWDNAILDYQLVIDWNPNFAVAHTNLGLAFYNQSNYAKSIESFEKAIKLAPTHPETYSNLGVVLYEVERYIEALAAYEKAIQYKSDYFEALSNRGNVLKELRLYDASLQSYDQALSINGNYFEALVNRGVVLFEMDRLEEALADFDLAIALKTDYSPAYSNRCNVLKEVGSLDQALVSIQKAVDLKCSELKSLQLQRRVLPPKPMVVEDACVVLLELRSLLEVHKIPFFLAYGTLLGIYRDAELLPHDKDLDVGLDWYCSRDHLIDVLKQSDKYWIDPKSTHPKNYEFNFGVIEKKRGISIDFFFFKPEGPYLLSGFHHLPHPLLWQFRKFDLGEIHYRNVTFNVPANPENFLIDIYGENWRIPDPYFDSLVSGYNLTDQAKPLSIIYAYSRLFDNLIDQNWKKAYGYCLQIKTFPQTLTDVDELMQLLEPLIV